MIMSFNPLANIKSAFNFGRSQEKKLYTQLRRLLQTENVKVEYVNQKVDKRLPYDFVVTRHKKTLTIDVETTPLKENWHQKWVDQGTVKEVLKRGLRMPLRKFEKQTGDRHLYLKLSPNRKCFFCFVFPEVNNYLIDGEQDRKNNAAHIKPGNNNFKVISWNSVDTLKDCVIVDDFLALKEKIVEMLKK